MTSSRLRAEAPAEVKWPPTQKFVLGQAEGAYRGVALAQLLTTTGDLGESALLGGLVGGFLAFGGQALPSGGWQETFAGALEAGGQGHGHSSSGGVRVRLVELRVKPQGGRTPGAIRCPVRGDETVL